jgi:type III pantothenate kinase
LLLVVDIGNTNIVIGLYGEQGLIHAWRLSSRRDVTADEFGVFLSGLLQDRASRVRDGVVASVVPPVTSQVVDAIKGMLGAEPLLVAPGIKTGLRLRMDYPQEVGADRIANAVAALGRYGGPTVVVDFGTATTLDVVTAEGDYLGGIITPGPQLGADALSARAARLPRVDLAVPPRVIGRNTIDSLRSGVVYGHAAMIDGLVRRVERELDEPVRIIATGGTATLISPLMDRVDGVDLDLTLEGLRLIHERNRPR